MTDPTPNPVMRLLIVDDHEVVRQGLVALLDRREGFQVVAEAGTVAEAIEAARRFQPDIVVMDVRLPDGSGVEACREIRAELPATRVVMLTSYPDEEAVLSAIVAGSAMAWACVASAPPLPPTPKQPYDPVKQPLDMCRPPFPGG